MIQFFHSNYVIFNSIFRTALRNLVPTLTNKFEQRRAVPWVNKLFGPQYHVELLRDKRNR